MAPPVRGNLSRMHGKLKLSKLFGSVVSASELATVLASNNTIVHSAMMSRRKPKSHGNLSNRVTAGGSRPVFERVFWLASALLVFSALIATHLGWFSPPAVKWPIVALMSAICWLYLALLVAYDELVFDSLDGIALLLLTWILVSVFWSEDRLGGFDSVFRWAMLIGIFLCMRRQNGSQYTLLIGAAFAMGASIVICLSVFDIIYEGGYFNRNDIAETMLLGMPILYPVALRKSERWWRWAVALFASCILAYLIFFNGSNIKFVIFATLATIFLVDKVLTRSRRLAVSVALICFSIFTIFVYFAWDRFSFFGSHSIRESLMPRIELAIKSIHLWLGNPVIGIGAGGYTAAIVKYREIPVPLLNISMDTADGRALLASPEAAHNDLLQFVVNYGLFGLVLVIAGIYLARLAISHWRSTPERTAGGVIVLSGLASAFVDFPLQKPASLVMFVLGLSLLLPFKLRDDISSTSASLALWKWPITGIALGMSMLFAWWPLAYIKGQASFAKSIKARDLVTALRSSDDSIEAYPFAYEFRRQAIVTLMHWDFQSDLHPIPPEEYDRIFHTSMSAGGDSATLLLRLHYLITSGRFRDQMSEVEHLRQLLLSQSARIPDVWIVEGMFAAAKSNRKDLEYALERYTVLTKGVPLQGHQEILSDLQRVLAELHGADNHQ